MRSDSDFNAECVCVQVCVCVYLGGAVLLGLLRQKQRQHRRVRLLHAGLIQNQQPQVVRFVIGPRHLWDYNMRSL